MTQLLQLAGIAAFLILLVAAPASGQAGATSADLTGVVRDQSSAVMPGVLITATNTGTNAPRTAVTDVEGRFLIRALPPGVYRVSAELSGFATVVQEDVRLSLGALVALDLSMQVAQVAERSRSRQPACPSTSARPG